MEKEVVSKRIQRERERALKNFTLKKEANPDSIHELIKLKRERVKNLKRKNNYFEHEKKLAQNFTTSSANFNKKLKIEGLRSSTESSLALVSKTPFITRV